MLLLVHQPGICDGDFGSLWSMYGWRPWVSLGPGDWSEAAPAVWQNPIMVTSCPELCPGLKTPWTPWQPLRPTRHTCSIAKYGQKNIIAYVPGTGTLAWRTCQKPCCTAGPPQGCTPQIRASWLWSGSTAHSTLPPADEKHDQSLGYWGLFLLFCQALQPVHPGCRPALRSAVGVEAP